MARPDQNQRYRLGDGLHHAIPAAERAGKDLINGIKQVGAAHQEDQTHGRYSGNKGYNQCHH